MNQPIIQIKDFKKMYGDFTAVDGISFDVQPGEIFALLGPNGAGKTSTLESLEGLRAPSGGSLTVAGFDPAKHPRQLRNVIGVQLQSSGLPDSITPDEAMKFFSAYHKVKPPFRPVGFTRKTQNPILSTFNRSTAPPISGSCSSPRSASALFG